MVEGVRNPRRASFAPFGGDQQDAIGPPDAIHRGAGSIFEDGDVLNFVGIQVVVVVYLDAIHQHQGFLAAVEGTYAANS